MTSEEQPAGPSAASSARPQRSGPSRRRRGFRPSRRPPRRPPAGSEAAAPPPDAHPETMQAPPGEFAEGVESFEPADSRDSPQGEAAPPLEPAAAESELSRRRADAVPAIRQAI